MAWLLFCGPNGISILFHIFLHKNFYAMYNKKLKQKKKEYFLMILEKYST